VRRRGAVAGKGKGRRFRGNEPTDFAKNMKGPEGSREGSARGGRAGAGVLNSRWKRKGDKGEKEKVNFIWLQEKSQREVDRGSHRQDPNRGGKKEMICSLRGKNEGKKLKSRTVTVRITATKSARARDQH